MAGKKPSLKNAVVNQFVKAYKTRDVGDTPVLSGQPSQANIPGQGMVKLGGNAEIQALVEKYREDNAINSPKNTVWRPIDKPFAQRTAREYDAMPHAPDDPRVKESYQALIDETMNMYEALRSAGYKPRWMGDKDPYAASPYQALMDIHQNKSLAVYPTKKGFGKGDEIDPDNHPMLGESGVKIDGEPALFNDIFRFVHDTLGHSPKGAGFRAMGEENAFNEHASLYSLAAQRALATETRGQNSWMNFGPNGDFNIRAGVLESIYAEQKTGNLSNLATYGGTALADQRRSRALDRNGVGYLGDLLSGAISADGERVSAVHYGKQLLEQIDPDQYGRGLSGRTVSEINLSHEPDWQNRFFAAPLVDQGAYKPELGLPGRVENHFQLPIESIYNLLADPDGLKNLPGVRSARNNNERYAAITKAIRDAGYSAHFQDTNNGKTLQVYDKVDVLREKVLHSSPVASLAAGALAAGWAAYSEDSDAGAYQELGKQALKAAAGGDKPSRLKPVDQFNNPRLLRTEGLDAVPDVPQFPLDRYDPPRGMPKNLSALMTPETSKRLTEAAKKGEDQGGREWYNTEPLQDEYIKRLGPVEGRVAFAKFIDKVAATSPRSTVASNIRRASYFDNLDRQGQPFAGIPKESIPPGYGHLAHNIHNTLMTDLQEGGSFSPEGRPKITSFSQNLQGNYQPMTMDTHNMSAVTGDSSVKKSPTKTQYKYLEEYQSEIADKLGLAPAQYQASVWMGGGTGVADSRPWIEVFDDVIARTAVRDGKGKDQVLDDFIRGKAPLYSLVGGGVLMGAINSEDSDAGVISQASDSRAQNPYIYPQENAVSEFNRLRSSRKERQTEAPDAMPAEFQALFSDPEQVDAIRQEAQARKGKTRKWRRDNPPSSGLVEASRRKMPGVGVLTASEYARRPSVGMDLVTGLATGVGRELYTNALGIVDPSKAKQARESGDWYTLGEGAQAVTDKLGDLATRYIEPGVQKGLNFMLDTPTPLMPYKNLREATDMAVDSYSEQTPENQRRLKQLGYAGLTAAAVVPFANSAMRTNRFTPQGSPQPTENLNNLLPAQ